MITRARLSRRGATVYDRLVRYLVAEGASLECSCGNDRARLQLRPRPHHVDQKVIAHVEDHKALRDIPSFGMCNSMTNPDVAAKTAAAGTLTKAPCIPPKFTIWQPGAKWIMQVFEGRRINALTSDSKCTCSYAGIVKIVKPNTELKVND